MISPLVRADFLEQNQILNGSRMKISFKFEGIEHPMYGKADVLAGTVPVILTKGSYPVHAYFKMTLEEQDAILSKYSNRVNHRVFEELDEESFRNVLREMLIGCCMINPIAHISSKELESCMDFIAAIDWMDNAFDQGEAFQGTDYDSTAFYKKYELFNSAMIHGDVSVYDKLGLAFPLLKSGFNFISHILNDVIKYDPTIKERLLHTHKCIYDSSETVSPVVAKYYESDEDGPLSDEAVKQISGLNAGFQMPIEYFAAHQNIVLSSKVRNSLLFKIYINGINLMSRLYNDILGIRKDLSQSNTFGGYNNLIIRKVILEKISISDALNAVLKLAQDTIKDIRISSKYLIKFFPEEKDAIEKFIRIANFVNDGQAFSYMVLFNIKGRYGSTKIDLIEDKS